jgi:hypothetical protein
MEKQCGRVFNQNETLMARADQAGLLFNAAILAILKRASQQIGK